MVDALAEFERHIRETPAPPIRLGDVPGEHLRLARHAARCGDSETLVGQFLSTRGYGPLGSEPAILRALAEADPWWISPDLCEIAEVARESMPPHHLHLEDVPAAHGLVFFGRPLSGLIDGAAFDNTISALGWNGWTEGVLVRRGASVMAASWRKRAKHRRNRHRRDWRIRRCPCCRSPRCPNRLVTR